MQEALDSIEHYELIVEPIHKPKVSTTEAVAGNETVEETNNITPAKTMTLMMVDVNILQVAETIRISRGPEYAPDMVAVRISDPLFTMTVDLKAAEVTRITDWGFQG